MKNRLKTFLMALVVFPCALALVACGGNVQLDSKATLNTSGDYQDSTADNLTTMYNDVDYKVAELKNGYKVTMDMSMTMSTMSITYKANAIVKQITDGMEAAVKMDMTIGESNVNAYAYYRDTKTGQKLTVKGKTDGQTVEETFTNVQAGLNKGTYFDYLDMFTQWDLDESDDFLATGTVVKKSVQGTSVKYELTVPITSTDNAKIYYVFENGKFMGCSVEGFTYTMSGADLGLGSSTTVGSVSISFNATIVAFDGDIDFPADF